MKASTQYQLSEIVHVLEQNHDREAERRTQPAHKHVYNILLLLLKLNPHLSTFLGIGESIRTYSLRILASISYAPAITFCLSLVSNRLLQLRNSNASYHFFSRFTFSSATNELNDTQALYRKVIFWSIQIFRLYCTSVCKVTFPGMITSLSKRTTYIGLRGCRWGHSNVSKLKQCNLRYHKKTGSAEYPDPKLTSSSWRVLLPTLFR